MIFAKVLDVICLLAMGKRALPFQDGIDNFWHLLGFDQRVNGVRENVIWHIPKEHHFGWHFRFKCRFAAKCHDGLKEFQGNAKAFGKSRKMLVVLPKRILESVLPLEVGDCPLGVLRIAENPSGICFRLNDENAPL